MRLSTLAYLFTALNGFLGVLAAPHPHIGSQDVPSNRSSGHKTGGKKYVILFDTERPAPPKVSEVLQRLGLSEAHPDVDHTFTNSAFRGFVGSMNDHCLDLLHGMKDVKHVEKDIKASVKEVETRVFAPWGLQRVSQPGIVTPAAGASEARYRYRYERVGNIGQGADIYVVDTGVNIDHDTFGRRAKVGFSKDGAGDLNAASDQSGHGTHCAGIAGANVFGVASLANVIGVKVLGADGGGYLSDVLRGIDYVVRTHNARKTRPGFVGSIASLSFALSSRSTSLEAALNAAFDTGVHLSIAAGNSQQDACQVSPSANGGTGADGRGGKGVTVGSMNIYDHISDFSNTGRCVDVYAPGETILSTWIGGTDVVQILSGTSMSAPHVAGLMAFLMVRNTALAKSPQYMKSYIAQTGFSGVLARSPYTLPEDLGILVNNGQRFGP